MENDTLSDTLKMGWDLPLAVGSGGWLEGGEEVCVDLRRAFLQNNSSLP